MAINPAPMPMVINGKRKTGIEKTLPMRSHCYSGLLLIVVLAACTPQNTTWQDFTKNGRGIAELRMDAANCQQVSQSVPQEQPSGVCNDKLTCSLSGIGAGLQTTRNRQDAFDTCMESRGWEQVTVAVKPQQNAVIEVAENSRRDDIKENVNNLLNEAQKAFQRKDYAQAMKLNMKAADQGNAEAQNNIGYLYMFGLGVAQDDNKAQYWLSLSTAQGNDKAKENLFLLSK